MATTKNTSDAELEEPPKAGNRLTVLGGILTALSLGTFLTFACLRREEMLGLAPNEWGDALAGAFAPLAFLWLVLGFFQQGQELRNSGRALWLQGRELQNSVEQQRELVQVTREELALVKEERDELARNACPIFTVGSRGHGPYSREKRSYGFYVENHGRDCTRVQIFGSDGLTITTAPLLATGQTTSSNLTLPVSGFDQVITIKYLDGRLQPGSTRFRLEMENERIRTTELEESAAGPE